MTTKSITVPNISCGHCTSTIERELLDLPGITSVKANVESKKKSTLHGMATPLNGQVLPSCSQK